MLIVRVACTGAPLTVTRVDAQTGAGLALVAIAQLRITVPLKPPDGVTVVMKVADLPGITLTEAGVGDASVKPGGIWTIRPTDVLWLADPEVPTIVRL